MTKSFLGRDMKRVTILIIMGIAIMVALSIIATLRLTRRCKCNKCSESKSTSTTETALEHQAEPLTEEDMLESFRAFEEIGNAYSNLQFETMREIFCGIVAVLCVASAADTVTFEFQA